MKHTTGLVMVLATTVLLGAGCWAVPASPKVAETLTNPTITAPTAAKLGFGALPKIQIPAGRAKVTLKKELPKLPPEITVLRLRLGTPDDVKLRNLTNALNIPAGMLGNFPQTTELNLEWKDDQGYRWSYRASARTLEFWNTATSGPLTLSELKPYSDVLATADSFIFARGLKGMYYRQGLVRPDWYGWWSDAQSRGLCMDRNVLNTVRALSSSAVLTGGVLPPLVAKETGACVKPEFPSRQVIAYRALLDEQDVVRPDGSYFDGAEIAIDSARGIVSSGRLNMYYDPERSNYPALSKEKVAALLAQGGLSGATGDMTMTDYDFVLLRLDDESVTPPDAYLIQSILAKGTRALANGATEPFNIVVPLLAQ